MGKKKNLKSIILALIILLIIVVFFLSGIFWIKSKNSQKNGRLQLPSELELFQSWFKRFVITQDEVCQENGKPIFYYFGASVCSHCQWEYPLVQTVSKNFPSQIIFRDNMDKLDKLESQDREVLNKYSQINKNSIPFLVLGCKYLRVGSGETYGQEAEEKYLTALICKITNNEPQQICFPIKDLIEEIK